jgi:hypothetical protein
MSCSESLFGIAQGIEMDRVVLIQEGEHVYFAPAIFMEIENMKTRRW